ncbi:hypothetical protein WOLCODRAFT_165538 [Wolfiporia cocos MD-104 SS10]|uniref:F-box domain-containing protein n=1 Tax=Wolfiporia cocos (strain MD-104) TaxID=742152 RepID=A0A2H3K975_WOLCO|nr:hypothetical protein WOLCODRAFT_165538 [Wolfiporia cocos MD-104 SS10]
MEPILLSLHKTNSRPMPIRLLTLNYDVLTLILAAASPRDALRFSFTCRAAYKLGTPRFLSEVTLRRSTPDKTTKQAAQFCAFILADTSTRAKHLRALIVENIVGSTLEAERACLRSLARVLRCAVNLSQISLDCAEHLFEVFPDAAEAMARLRRLDEVRFTLVFDTKSAQTLERMSSRPRRLKLANVAYDLPPSSVFPFKPLHNFTRSLQNLDLLGCATIIETLEQPAIWPLVRTLRLAGKARSLAIFARAFPNVHRLRLDMVHTSDAAPTTEWTQLDRVFVDNVTTAPITSKIRHLTICLSVGRTDQLLLTYPRILTLRSAAPIVLSCKLAGPFAHDMQWVALAVGPQTRYLRVHSGWSTTMSVAPEEIERQLICYAHAFSHLPLIAMSLCHDLQEEVAPDTLRSRVPQLVKAAAAQSPSLQYISVEYKDDTATPPDWFEVIHWPTEDLPCLQALSASDSALLSKRLSNMSRESDSCTG